MRYQSLKGMEDILPGQIEAWQVLESKTRDFFEAYGFREIRTPILESAELFSRSIGEASDIVHKEMYEFEDRGGRRITLRPEMTASVVRAAIEHNLIRQNEPTYLYYTGSMYRAERPQAGRKREFHQIGAETLNTHSAVNDAELMIMAARFLEMLGLSKFKMKINNLGTAEDRSQYQKKLLEYFNSKKEKICDDCKFRLTKNVLRIFDCKVAECQPAIKAAPAMELSKSAKEDFEKIQSLLKFAKVPFQAEPKLVRGLDYYTGCVFEVTAEGLGAQDAVLAGGRYDGLIESLGGPKVGASGFAIGVERMLTALEASGAQLAQTLVNDTVYVAAIAHGESSCEFYRTIADYLFRAKKRAHFSFKDSGVGQHLKQANKAQAGFAIIVGEDEFKAGELTLKNMTDGSQKKIKPSELAKAF